MFQVHLLYKQSILRKTGCQVYSLKKIKRKNINKLPAALSFINGQIEAGYLFSEAEQLASRGGEKARAPSTLKILAFTSGTSELAF